MTASRDRLGGRRSDEGIVIPIVALLMVTFMVMAAFAVDMGSVYSARRKDQNAVDAATLAGAQALTGSDPQVLLQVSNYLHDNLDLAPGTLNLDAAECDDSEQLAVEVKNSAGEGQGCVTRNLAGTLLRVQIPTRDLQSTFGRVIGRNSYSHSAFAVAGLVREGYGGVLPFGVFGDPAYGNVCIRTPNNDDFQPCDGTSEGESHALDFGVFNSSPTDCQGGGAGGNPDARIAGNIAAGVDHFLVLAQNQAETARLDTRVCLNPDDYTEDPNGAETFQSAGNIPGIAGLFSNQTFRDGFGARLTRPTMVNYSETPLNVEGVLNVDSTPLWAFIADDAQTSEIPSACERAVFENGETGNFAALPLAVRERLDGEEGPGVPTAAAREIQLELLLSRCFDHYIYGEWLEPSLNAEDPRTGCSAAKPQPCTGVVFGRNSSTGVQQPEVWDIQMSSRFAYVPRAWQAIATNCPTTTSGVNCITFKEFVPIFLQKLCLGNAGCSEGTFSPGVGRHDPKTQNDSRVAGITAFAFHPNMLPTGLSGPNAPFDLNVNLFIRLVR